MNSEIANLSGEIKTIKNRIAKAERRLSAGKAPLANSESEEDRKNRLQHVLGKKEERLTLLQKGEEC
jgi:hypothetical protein